MAEYSKSEEPDENTLKSVYLGKPYITKTLVCTINMDAMQRLFTVVGLSEFRNISFAPKQEEFTLQHVLFDQSLAFSSSDS